MDNFYESIGSNKRKSLLVVAGFFAFVSVTLYVFFSAISVYLGYEPGGLGVIGFALIASGVSSFVSYYYSDKIVLGISKARPADKSVDAQFYSIAENLAIGAGIPMPRLYVIDDSAPNAFATGRDPKHAVIAATTGLLTKLDRTELEGVVAHEMGHIRNYDIRLMAVVSVMVGLIALLADMFLRFRFVSGDRKSGNAGAVIFLIGLAFALLSPVIASLIKLAISRRREFLADATSVAITRQPSGLISALQKISADHEPLEVANKATAHLYIENPFKDKIGGGRSKFASLFNTHPPIEERIAALSKMV